VGWVGRGSVVGASGRGNVVGVSGRGVVMSTLSYCKLVISIMSPLLSLWLFL